MPPLAKKRYRDSDFEDGSSAQGTVEYTVSGAATEADAKTAIRAAITTAGEDPMEGLSLLSVRARRTSDANGGTWAGYAHYGIPQPGEFQAVGTGSVRYELGGSTQRVTQSKETLSSTEAAGFTEINFQNAVNVSRSDNGFEVQGVDIPSPELRMIKTWTFASGDVDAAYMLQLLNLFNHTNDAVFEGWAIGTVLFLGASTRETGNNTTEVEQEFTISPDATNIDVGNGITVPSKPGHAQLWVHYEPEAASATTPTIPVPLQANVERHFDPGDFDLLTPP